jgi:hypothetical protein
LPLCLFFISFSIHYPCLVLNVSVYLFNTIFLVQIKCTICLPFSKFKQSFRREILTINTLFFKHRITAVLKVNKVTKSDRSSCVNSDNLCGDHQYTKSDRSSCVNSDNLCGDHQNTKSDGSSCVNSDNLCGDHQNTKSDRSSCVNSDNVCGDHLNCCYFIYL